MHHVCLEYGSNYGMARRPRIREVGMALYLILKGGKRFGEWISDSSHSDDFG